uniref:Pol n=1 Tax=Solanum tuberosum TaxID=4113 RepID=M1AVS2_SOLTU
MAFPCRIEHKAMWTLKKLKLDWGAASSQRLNEMNELDVLHLKAYEISALYKKRMKKYHDQNIDKSKKFPSDLVLLFNSRLRLFPRKLKSK